VTGVTLDHLVGGLETRRRDLVHRHLLVVGLLSTDDWGIGHQREVDARVGHQVSLELSEVHIEGTIKPQRSSDGRDYLTNETVEVAVRGSVDVKVLAADVVDGLVVNHEGAVGVLQGGMRGQDRVVWLDDGGGDLWSWVDGKLELGLLAVVNGQSLHEKGSESGSGTTTEGVEDEETLETSTLIGQLSDSVEHQVHDLLTNGIVTSGVVVSGILLTGDQLLWVEELSVGTSSDLVDDGWLEIDEDGSWNVLAGAGLTEEGVETVVTATDGLVAWHLTVWLDAVLEAVQLPACVTDLDTGLANVDGDTLSHFEFSGLI